MLRSAAERNIVEVIRMESALPNPETGKKSADPALFMALHVEQLRNIPGLMRDIQACVDAHPDTIQGGTKPWDDGGGYQWDDQGDEEEDDAWTD